MLVTDETTGATDSLKQIFIYITFALFIFRHVFPPMWGTNMIFEDTNVDDGKCHTSKFKHTAMMQSLIFFAITRYLNAIYFLTHGLM